MNNKSEKINFKRMIVLSLVIGIGIFFFMFLVTTTWIGYEVQDRCDSAKAKYSGECVDSLIQYLDDEENSIRSRNSAIWALGQLGDEKALDVLNKYYTGNIPDHEPIDLIISQYELRKAINLCEGGFNIGALVWRN